MKSGGLLHPELLALIARVGHTDTIVIADVGLPIPRNVPRIELAVVAGLPDLLSVLRAVVAELVVESVTLASETRIHSPAFHHQLESVLHAPTVEVDHETLKGMLHHAAAVIRTGETTPYANVILHCGVDF
ncbi:D-ribose pyranase [Deinococcus oregonensis]|uniref:D-ribose pyranase n=1 Tax=Deinococcus oregonensis TaxID=1805970 RepID=A0ABV6AV82_9DEIO